MKGTASNSISILEEKDTTAEKELGLESYDVGIVPLCALLIFTTTCLPPYFSTGVKIKPIQWTKLGWNAFVHL